ncbi:ATP phosphoribosyltransferase regulatory subunit [Gammaproteobacteria bacterium 45_16_T64]|nr:ATP phosphoribosyltransferase regulatory subunit [Gammaproteobacteria bacterium 45_16_T64]
MSIADRWLLPEGVEEILPNQAASLESLRRELLDLYRSWGYELVIPPLVEYLESLLIGSGNDLALQTFKLTDQSTGRLMGVRADMTPQVARIDAHTLNRQGPVRLCYAGDVLHTKPTSLSASRSAMQVGVELFGHAGVESDIEVILLMLDTLTVAGCEDIHLDLGHVAIYRVLAELAGLDEAQEMTLFDIYQRKSVPELAEFLDANLADSPLKDKFIVLSELAGDQQVLARAKALFAPVSDALAQAIDDLQVIADTIKARKPGVVLYFDLGELRGYHYHTGAVFSAYLPNVGHSVASGGRYDHIGEVFGRARAATGFSTDLASLIKIKRQATSSSLPLVFAPNSSEPALLEEVTKLRQQGVRVVVSLSGQTETAEEMGCTQQLTLQDGRWVMCAV